MCLKDSGDKGLGLKVQDLWFTAWLKATGISSGSSIVRFSNDESCSWQELSPNLLVNVNLQFTFRATLAILLPSLRQSKGCLHV